MPTKAMEFTKPCNIGIAFLLLALLLAMSPFPANSELAPTANSELPPATNSELSPTTSAELPPATSEVAPAAGAAHGGGGVIPGAGGVIERTTKQQILTTIPPAAAAAQLFITSASGKFQGYFLRRGTAPGAGGYGNDFCYVQIQGPSGESVWESECTPVSNVNACTLVFSDAGLEVFDGSNSAWDTDVDDDEHLETMVLLDVGDMQIRDKGGELAWKAADHPRINQECGSLGAPGLAYAHAPFSHPIGGDRTVFGQPVGNHHGGPLGGFRPAGGVGGVGGEEEEQALGGSKQPLGGVNREEPLVDNNPFDSMASRKVAFGGIRVGLLGVMINLALLMVL